LSFLDLEDGEKVPVWPSSGQLECIIMKAGWPPGKVKFRDFLMIYVIK
jgi:hypothetical protein